MPAAAGLAIVSAGTETGLSSKYYLQDIIIVKTVFSLPG
jgi:hypothetical protein